jgi:hypothetical protein
MINDYQDRINQVTNLQKKYGMEPRDDSILTKKFANGNTTLTAEEVAKELVCVDFIYKNTLYGEFIEDYMRELASLIKCKYKLSWDDTWELARFYGPTSLKLMCLISSQQNIPNFSNYTHT